MISAVMTRITLNFTPVFRPKLKPTHFLNCFLALKCQLLLYLNAIRLQCVDIYVKSSREFLSEETAPTKRAAPYTRQSDAATRGLPGRVVLRM